MQIRSKIPSPFPNIGLVRMRTRFAISYVPRVAADYAVEVVPTI
jgi:hypothetical protein